MSDSITKVQGHLDLGNNSSIINTDLKNTSLEALTQAQINSIVSPKAGLAVYNIDTKKINVYYGTSWTDGSVLDTLTAKLLTTTYTTTGVAPNFFINVPDITDLSNLVDKQIRIKIHTPIVYGTNVTLNINGLGAKNISNYDLVNTSFRFSTLAGYILTLIYNGTVFTLVDVGEANPVSGGSINQTVGGAKTFTNQIDITSNLGIGITNTSGYIYTKQNSRLLDTVGDIRMYSWDGVIYTQQCTVASPTKAGGTWVAVSNTSISTTYSRGVVGVATFTGTSMVINTIDTPIVYDTVVNGTLTADTDSEITLGVLCKREGGRVVFGESPLHTKQGNLHEVLLTISHGLTGSATGVVEYDIISNSSGAKVNQGSVILTAKDTTVQYCIAFNTVSDANSIINGYRIVFKTTTPITITQDRVRLIAVAK